MNFEAIERIEDLETVSEESVWQNFERLAAFIFEKNEFRVNVNTVKTLNKNEGSTMLSPGRTVRLFLSNARNGRATATGYLH